jgi:hypothetical protein
MDSFLDGDSRPKNNLSSVYGEYLLRMGYGRLILEAQKDGFKIATIKWRDSDGDYHVSNFRRK